MKAKLIKLSCLLLTWVICLGLRVYWTSQREGFHSDEVSSILVTYYKNIMWDEYPALDQVFHGDELKYMIFGEKGNNLKEAVKDIGRLWRDTHGDGVHTNIFYTLYRLALVGLNSGDMKDIIFRGSILNLFLFSISYFIFFLFLRSLMFRITSDGGRFSHAAPYIICFCTFMTPVTVSTTLFIRPYQLQETMCIIFIYTFYKFFDMPKVIRQDNKYFFNISFTVMLSVVTALTLLSHYFSLVLVCLFGLYCLSFLIYKKKYPETLAYFLVLVFAVLLADVLDHVYLYNGIGGLVLRNYHRDVALNGFMEYSSYVLSLLYNYYFTLPVIVLCLLWLVYIVLSKTKLLFSPVVFTIISITIVNNICVTILAPYIHIHYTAPVFPFFSVLLLYFLCSIKDRKSFILFSFGCILAFTSSAVCDLGKIEKVAAHYKKADFYFTRDADIPVVFIINRPFQYTNIIPYLSDSQEYIFENNVESAVDFVIQKKTAECYLIVPYEDKNNVVSYIKNSNIFSIESVFDYSIIESGKLWNQNIWIKVNHREPI